MGQGKLLLWLSLLQVLASQKQLENRYKAAQQASEDWWMHGSIILLNSFSWSCGFSFSFNTGSVKCNLLLGRVMRTLLVKLWSKKILCCKDNNKKILWFFPDAFSYQLLSRNQLLVSCLKMHVLCLLEICI